MSIPFPLGIRIDITREEGVGGLDVGDKDQFGGVPVFLLQLIDQAAQDGGLAGTDRTVHVQRADTLFGHVLDFGEGFLNLVGEVEETGIGRDPKWLLI